MKRTETYATADMAMHATTTAGASTGLPKGRTPMAISVDSRPHILARRSARWARRANH